MTLRILFLLIQFYLSSSSSFNYEIGARVKDKVSGFTQLIGRALDIPFYLYQIGAINISTDPLDVSTRTFFPIIKSFPEIVNIYAGCESGLFYGYIEDGLTFNLSLYYTQTNNDSGIWTEFDFPFNIRGEPNGSQVPNLNYTYDPRGRPWYIQAKAALKPIWSSPYLDTTGNPTITLVYPATNNTLYSKSSIYKPELLCNLAIDVFLTTINKFLVSTYEDTDRDVFIVEKSTGNLIGNSFGSPIATGTEGNLNFIRANESENVLIAGSTNKLISTRWTTELTIYNSHYLQSIDYVDSIQGIDWYIVVLLPASVDVDHVGPNNPIYPTVIVFASISLTIQVIGIGITVFYRHSRLVKLSQPFFTYMVLFGGIVLSIFCFFNLGPNTKVSCAIRPFMFNIAFTIVFAPLLIKSIRVYQLFIINLMEKKKLIPSWQFFLYAMIFVIIDIIILCITLYAVGSGTNPQTKLVMQSNGAYGELTRCGYYGNNALLIAECVYKGSIVLLACYFSFKTRKVVDEIAGSKILFAIVYNIAFVSVVVLGISRAITAIPTVVIIETVGICYCISVNACLFVLPNFLKIISIGDAEAADVVMEKVFSKAPGSTGSVGKRSNKSQIVPSQVVVGGRGSIVHDHISHKSAISQLDEVPNN